MTLMPLIFTSAENPIDPDPGIYRGVPFEEYQSWNCFSKSMVSHALKSGLHLDHYIHGERKTKAMSFGSLVDCLVLEPGLYADRYVLQPATYETEKTSGRGANKITETVEKPWNLSSLVCKAIAHEIEQSGKIIVTEADLAKGHAIRDALMASPEAAVAITTGVKQVSFVWINEDTGVKCKGRADLTNPTTIDDLKTAIDASPEEFGRAAGRFGYHVQAAAYARAWEQLTGEARESRFIVAETSGVNAVALYALNRLSMLAGGYAFDRALLRVRGWLDTGITGYSPQWEPIDVPRWVINQEAEMEAEITPLPEARLVPRREEAK